MNGIKQQVIQELNDRGLKVDGPFEGDFTTWVGCHAIPVDKPIALDPWDEEEAKEQDKHRVNGMVQDFAEWLEWRIDNGKLKPFTP